MIKIPLHRLELALKFAKKYKDCRLKQIAHNVVIGNQEDDNLLVFPCYTQGNEIEINLDNNLKKIVAFFKQQKIDNIDIDDNGISVNNIHININMTTKLSAHYLDIYKSTYSSSNDDFELIYIYDQIYKIFDFANFASNDPARLSINGVFISSNGELAATNGKRLITNQKVLVNRSPHGSIIIPLSTIKHLKTIFKERGFFFYKHKTIKDLYKFSNDVFTLYTTKQDGTYPDYKRCFPTKKQEIYICNGNDLYEAVVQSYKRDVFDCCYIDIEFCGTLGKIKVAADYGFSRKIDLCQMSDRTDRVVKINPLYLDFLKGKSCVKIKVIDHLQPIIVEDNENKYVIMPMRG
ncbi:MAG: hypothetical protein VB017_05565 [Endomicrobiaceae bacterium]|nr:hypothetical protein [Endomicrobiaceae bacterium]